MSAQDSAVSEKNLFEPGCGSLDWISTADMLLPLLFINEHLVFVDYGFELSIYTARTIPTGKLMHPQSGCRNWLD